MKVLIADDDLHLNQGLALLLQKEGFECHTVKNGKDALYQLGEYKPDLCIFDVMMPYLSGIELCAVMRERGLFQPVLLLTAFDEQVDKIEGFRLGADDYMTKPFNPDELIARVTALARREQYLKSRQPAQSKTFQLGELTVDADCMLLSYVDEKVCLSKRELEFLQMLHASGGRVLSKDEILDKCWGRAYLPNSRTLDQFLSVLRQKMEKDLGAPRIVQTVYGMGYKLKGVG